MTEDPPADDPSSGRRLPHACSVMRINVEDSRVPLEYSSRLREYFIPLQASSAIQCLTYCPFCGVTLPPSLRDEYGEAMEALGLEFFDEPPPSHRDDRWWWGQ